MCQLVLIVPLLPIRHGENRKSRLCPQINLCFQNKQSYLERLFGDGIILITAEPRLPVSRVQTVPEHIDIEEDVLLMRKAFSPEMNH